MVLRFRGPGQRGISVGTSPNSFAHESFKISWCQAARELEPDIVLQSFDPFDLSPS